MGWTPRVSVSAAHRLNDTLDEALDFLEHSPKGCPVYMPKIPIDAELRYKLFSERYRIVFEVADNVVYVYDIQDCRQGVDNFALLGTTADTRLPWSGTYYLTTARVDLAGTPDDGEPYPDDTDLGNVDTGGGPGGVAGWNPNTGA